MTEPMLSVYNANVWYGAIHAIKNVSFEVNEDEIVALIGANGAGKSTTLKTISGLLRSKTGSITFQGEDIAHTPADKLVAKGLAQVPEGRRVFLEMSVEENLEMGAYTQPKSTIAPRSRARLRAIPTAERAPSPGCRHAFGRRAADARHGSRSHEQPQASHAR